MMNREKQQIFVTTRLKNSLLMCLAAVLLFAGCFIDGRGSGVSFSIHTDRGPKTPQKIDAFKDLDALAQHYGLVRVRRAPGDEDLKLVHYLSTSTQSDPGIFLSAVYIPSLKDIYVILSANYDKRAQQDIDAMYAEFRRKFNTHYTPSALTVE